MKTEELKNIGLNEEQIKEVFKLNGLAVEAAKKDYEDIKEQLTLKETEMTSLEEQVKGYTTQLEELKGSQGASEELKAKIKEYEQQMEELEKTKNEELSKVKFNSKLENTLLQVNAKDIGDILPQLDREVLKLEDGKILGLEEQISTLKESKPYLFKDDKPAGTGGSVGNRKREQETVDPFLEGLGLK